MPEELFGPTEALWDYIGATAESFDADVRLQDGDRVRAGGRELRVVARPGHSATDTLFVDRAARLAFVGDHLLAKISPNTEIYRTADASRSRPRIDYLNGLRRTARDATPAAASRTRSGRLQRPRACSARVCPAPQTVQANHPHPRARVPPPRSRSARQLWREAIVREQPLLVVWEVLGHLDLMLAAGIADERVGDRRALAILAGTRARAPIAHAG